MAKAIRYKARCGACGRLISFVEGPCGATPYRHICVGVSQPQRFRMASHPIEWFRSGVLIITPATEKF